MRSVCPRRRPRFWKVQRTRCFFLETVFRLSSTLDDFCFIFVSVWDKIFYCFRNVFFALLFVLFCLTFINLCGWFCLCNFDFVEWKYLLFSLYFDCNVLFLFYDMSIWCVFCFILNFWKHCLQSRMLNSYKWFENEEGESCDMHRVAFHFTFLVFVCSIG